MHKNENMSVADTSENKMGKYLVIKLKWWTVYMMKKPLVKMIKRLIYSAE